MTGGTEVAAASTKTDSTKSAKTDTTKSAKTDTTKSAKTDSTKSAKTDSTKSDSTKSKNSKSKTGTNSTKSKSTKSKTGTNSTKSKSTKSKKSSTKASGQSDQNQDTEAPVIDGTNDILVPLGKTVSYRDNVTAKDNVDGKVDLEINADGVDLNTPGTYQVTYSAVDKAGNKAEKTVNVTVVDIACSEAQVRQAAVQVVNSIITPQMTAGQRLRAIYDYVQHNIAYGNDADKSDWLQAAYQGLIYHKGDCFVFASTSRALLDAAGISNLYVEMMPVSQIEVKNGDDRQLKLDEDLEHCWNLVNIGAGWYHFDTTPREISADFCYVTDSFMQDYSANSGKVYDYTHEYDRSLYPPVVQ